MTADRRQALRLRRRPSWTREHVEPRARRVGATGPAEYPVSVDVDDRLYVRRPGELREKPSGESSAPRSARSSSVRKAITRSRDGTSAVYHQPSGHDSTSVRVSSSSFSARGLPKRAQKARSRSAVRRVAPRARAIAPERPVASTTQRQATSSCRPDRQRRTSPAVPDTTRAPGMTWALPRRQRRAPWRRSGRGRGDGRAPPGQR
jgi:hypothetical protein